MRSFQLTVMLRERKTTFMIMLGSLLDKLIQFIYFVVHAFGKLKSKNAHVCRAMCYRLARALVKSSRYFFMKNNFQLLCCCQVTAPLLMITQLIWGIILDGFCQKLSEIATFHKNVITCFVILSTSSNFLSKINNCL